MAKYNPFDPANGYSEEDRLALNGKCASLINQAYKNPFPGTKIRLDGVNDVYLLLSVTVTSSGGLDDDYAARIKALLMEEILSAGTTIRLQTFIRPIMESVSGVDYVEIRGLLSEKPDIEGVADNSMLTGIVPVEINQQPVLSMSGIRVVKA